MSAKQWKLEPVNLLTQRSAICSRWLIFQFDFSLLAPCGTLVDKPWVQHGSRAGTTATWRSLGCNHSLAAWWAATSSALSCTCPQLLPQCPQGQRSLDLPVSAFMKMFFVSSLSCLWILDAYDIGKQTWGSVYLIHFNIYVSAFHQNYLLLSTLIQKGKHVVFCILKSD